MFTERTSIVRDVHARSIAAAAIDGVTGELLQSKLTPSFDHVRSWITDLPGPVAVAYEAGPTGFGLHRQLTAAGIRCVVVAPSKLHKPAGDRVKTDAKDAVHLARLLRLVQIESPVAIPTADQEAARDLGPGSGGLSRRLDACTASAVEAASAARVVYYGGAAWTGRHGQWLRTQAVSQLPWSATQLAFDADTRPCWPPRPAATGWMT